MMDERFYRTYAFVSATFYEQLALWRECQANRIPWEQDNIGREETIAEDVGGYPMRVDFSWASVNGKLIAFYERSGWTYSEAIMRDWIEIQFPNAKSENSLNFWNAIK